MLTDESRVLKIKDDGQGKGEILRSTVIAFHDLDDELEVIDQRPWTSVPICDRMIFIDDYCFSMQSKLQWKAN